MRRFLIYIPFVLLAGAVFVGYLYMPTEWFLVSTGLLLLFVVFYRREDRAGEVREVPQVMPQTASILEGIVSPAFLYDQNFKIVMFSSSAEKMFGLSAKEALGHVVSPKDAQDIRWQRIVQVVFPSLAPSIVPRSKEGELPQIVDITFSSPEAEWRTITSRVSEPAFQGFLKVVQDRTREAVMLKEKTEFITVASHQLRTPVTSIIWALSSLANSPEVQGNAKEMVQSAYGSAQQLGNIVEDLLSISKIEEGKLGYNFKQADLTAFLTSILSNALPQARRLGIKMFFDKPEHLPPVFIDEAKLGMAIGNILDNTIRYNVKDGEVAVRVKLLSDKPFIQISIRDTGIGIPPEDIKNIFQKFFRGSNAVKFETQGSGLGLYITQSIIQAHGGSIRVDSEVNKGTVFTLEIPTDQTLIPPKEVPIS